MNELICLKYLCVQIWQPDLANLDIAAKELGGFHRGFGKAASQCKRGAKIKYFFAARRPLGPKIPNSVGHICTQIEEGFGALSHWGKSGFCSALWYCAEVETSFASWEPGDGTYMSRFSSVQVCTQPILHKSVKEFTEKVFYYSFGHLSFTWHIITLNSKRNYTLCSRVSTQNVGGIGPQHS